MNEHSKTFAADIATHGWIVLKVSANGPGPDFAYSIGLHQTYDHPEIIIIGLPHDVAHRIVNDVGASIRDGTKFQAGVVYPDILEGYEVTFRSVPPHQYGPYLGSASRYYGDQPFSVFQLVYPDRSHRWPWQDGVSASFRAGQPVLADEGQPEWYKD